MLRACLDENPAQWEEKLPYVVSAYNNSVNSVTLKSPYELVFGKTMALPLSVTGYQTKSYNYDDYAHHLRENLALGTNEKHSKTDKIRQKLCRSL